MGQFLVLNNMLLVICIAIMLVLGFVIFRHGKNKISNQLFSLCITSAIFWVLINLIANLAVFKGDESSYLFWTKLSILGPSFLPLLLILFTNSFPKNKITINKSYIWILGIITAIILLLMPTRYNIEDVEITDPNTMASTFKPGILLIFFIAYLLVGIFIISYVLIKKYLKSSEIEKSQIKNILIGLVSSVLVGTIMSAILPFFGYTKLINISPASTIFFIGFTSYAIIKLQFLNVRLIIAEMITYLVLIILTVEIFFSRSLTEGIFRVIFLITMAYGGYVLIISMQREINQREQLQKLTKQLELANKHLQELDKMKTEFVSIASHDLLTPISAIQGYLSMILDENIAPVENEKARDYLSIVYASANRLAKLVQDLLNVSRIDQGRLVIDRRPITIEKSIQHVYDELEIKAKKQGLELVWEKPEKPLPKVLADPDKVQEVLSNLIGNAIKFTKTGSVKIKTEIIEKDRDRIEMDKMGEDKDRDYVVVHIQDTGVGIPKEEIPNLFQKFHRVGSWVTREAYGTGLGLYIAKSMVTLMGGKIWCESEEGKGSTFSFSLPVAKPSDKREISGDILGLGTEEEKKLLKEGAGRKIIIKKAPRTNHVLGDIAKDNIGRKS